MSSIWGWPSSNLTFAATILVIKVGRFVCPGTFGKFEKITILLILAQRGFLLRTESGLKFKIFHRNPANTHCFHLSLAAIAVILIEHHDVYNAKGSLQNKFSVKVRILSQLA